MTDLPLLISTLEEGGEGGRELDCKVARALGWHRVEPRFTRNKKGGWISPDEFLGVYPDGAPVYGQHGTSLHTDPPRWSTSVNAALALIGEQLPGWTYTLTYWPPDAEAGFTRVTLGGPGYISDETMSDTFEVTKDGNVPALALCLALCRALQAQGGNP